MKGWVKDWYDENLAWHYAPIQNGLGEHGIPDRVGCMPVKITPEMVGMTIGLFVAVEAKKPGRRGEKWRGATGHQRDNLVAIARAGGVGMVVDSKESIAQIEVEINEMRHGVQFEVQPELLDG